MSTTFFSATNNFEKNYKPKKKTRIKLVLKQIFQPTEPARNSDSLLLLKKKKTTT